MFNKTINNFNFNFFNYGSDDAIKICKALNLTPAIVQPDPSPVVSKEPEQTDRDENVKPIE
ncbi:MAG: hypothetical protein LBP59_04775 [Planctomycetaceae bacterium]|nr:hypothetical protein [Planctomycetaceae bacterium]